MDNDRLAALAHYIIWKCPDPTKLGATKLNKILWFADAINYMRSGRAITGERYIKRQFGPVPHGIMMARDRLKNTGSIAVAEGVYAGYPQTHFMALTKPDLSGFTAEEVSLVDEVIEKIRDGYTAARVSDLTHDRVWEAAEIGEEIPLHAMYASEEGELTGEDMQWATAEVERLGLMG